MKNLIILFTCINVLDFTSAMQAEHKASTSALPRTFPTNVPTYVYIQKKNGEVYFGYMNRDSRNTPDWAKKMEFDLNEAAEHVFVRMPVGIHFIAIVRHIELAKNIPVEYPKEHRCFILSDNVHVYVADLLPINATDLLYMIPYPIRILVRMPDEHNQQRYAGGLRYYQGPHPKWLRAN